MPVRSSVVVVVEVVVIVDVVVVVWVVSVEEAKGRDLFHFVVVGIDGGRLRCNDLNLNISQSQQTPNKWYGDYFPVQVEFGIGSCYYFVWEEQEQGIGELQSKESAKIKYQQ